MVTIYSLETTKLPDETSKDYLQRLCSIRDTIGITWQQLTETANKELGLNRSLCWYWRNFHNGAFLPDYETTCNCDEVYSIPASEEESDSISSVIKLKKEKVKLSDERVQANAYIRRLSREETIKEIAHEYAEKMAASHELTIVDHPAVAETALPKEGVLLLSDWHYGMTCDNPWNKFNPEICKQRVNKLLDKVIEHVKEHSLHKVTVLNLSDLIAGRIHTQIRIESRFDVITQTMDVAEILAQFLNVLSKYCYVDYYDCLDNHSRLEPNKKESLDLESLARVIPWFLKERLADNKNILISCNEFGSDIITCNVMGHNVIGVHGDNDNPLTALEKLSLMTHRHYDMLCTAHRHHFEMNERTHSIIVSNASLMGTDSYAEKLRLSSDPSQTLVIVTPENVCECIYRIVLK